MSENRSLLIFIRNCLVKKLKMYNEIKFCFFLKNSKDSYSLNATGRLPTQLVQNIIYTPCFLTVENLESTKKKLRLKNMESGHQNCGRSYFVSLILSQIIIIFSFFTIYINKISKLFINKCKKKSLFKLITCYITHNRILVIFLHFKSS